MTPDYGPALIRYYEDERDRGHFTPPTPRSQELPSAIVECPQCGALPGDEHSYDCLAGEELL